MNNYKERMKTLEGLEAQLALLRAELEDDMKEPIIYKHPAMTFQVHSTNLGEMTWYEAEKACAKLGDGWRLPTRAELLFMYETQSAAIAGRGNWCSIELVSNYAWTQNMFYGHQSLNKKTDLYNVRAVRTIYKLKRSVKDIFESNL